MSFEGVRTFAQRLLGSFGDEMDDLERIERVPPRGTPGRQRKFNDVPSLFFEDIQDIYTIFSNFAEVDPTSQTRRRLSDGLGEEWEPVSIEADGYAIRRLEQLQSPRLGRIQNLSMSTYLLQLSLRCEPYALWLRVHNDDESTLSAFARVEQIIEPRRKRFIGFIRSWKFMVILLLFTYLCMFISAQVFGSSYGFLLFVAFASAQVLYWVWEVWIWGRRRSVVIPKHRSEAPEFWEENGREILKWTLIALVPTCLVALAGWLIGLF